MNAKALRILTEFYSTPWAMLPQTLAAAQAILHRWATGAKLSDDEIRAAVGETPEAMQARRASEARSGGDNIAVLPVFGVIGHRAHLVYDISSGVGTSTELLGKAFREVLKDPAVGAIVLDIDSPGGSVFGVGELAAEIYAARGQKPIIASVNSMAASAAYWLASAADEVVITPAGQSGSIGVWAAHEDWSKHLQAFGVDVTLISAGKFKVEGNPYGALTDDARAAMQDTVDKYYGMFVKAVQHNRGAESPKVVRDGYGEGRMLLAADSVKANLADRVGTFEEVIAGLQEKFAKKADRAARRSSAEAQRQLQIAGAQ